MFTPDHPQFDWSRARCRADGKDPSFFFPSFESGPNRFMREIIEQRIRDYCAQCPMNYSCYEAARLRGERNGFWGGVSFEQGHHARRPKPLIRKAV